MKPPGLYALLAEFESPEELVHAAEKTREAGYRKIDAYSPVPVAGLDEALGLGRSFMSTIVLVGGLIGAAAGYALQYWVSVIEYPMNVGGRPYHSWVAFIPITFETTVLFAAFSAVLGMIALNGLPRPHHPIFNAPNFAMASRHRFFLAIEAEDEQFDLVRSRDFLLGLHPKEVAEVER